MPVDTYDPNYFKQSILDHFDIRQVYAKNLIKITKQNQTVLNKYIRNRHGHTRYPDWLSVL